MYYQGLINKYREYLPVTEKTPIVTLNEGNTPLIKAENLAKKAVGMPKIKKVGDAIVQTPVTGWIEKKLSTSLNASQKQAVDKFFSSNAFLKCLPSVAKGLFFVGASIAGYKLGGYISDKVLGKEKTKAEKNA